MIVLVEISVKVVVETAVSVIVWESVWNIVVVVLNVPVVVEPVIVVVLYSCTVAVAVSGGGVTDLTGVETANIKATSGQRVWVEVPVGTELMDDLLRMVVHPVCVTVDEARVMVKIEAYIPGAEASKEKRNWINIMMSSFDTGRKCQR